MHSLYGLSPSAPAYINKAFVLVIVAASLVVNSSGRLLPFGDTDDDDAGSRVRRADGNNMTTELPLNLGDGTTANLKAIFLGRCYDCEYCSEEQAGLYDCSGLWDAFSSSFSYQEPCNSVPEDFDDYANMAFVPLTNDQTLFYSGMYSMAMAIGRQSSDFTNIELTMLGGLVNGITFCGMVDAPGINYDACPTFGSCENDTQDAFWKKSSQRFAGQASGDVTVILDGSRADGAYRPTSFFRLQEVANLDPAKVTSLTAYVVHSLNGDVTEKCVTGSLLELQEDITAKRITFECIDDPSITRHVQCIQDPGHDTCLPYTDSAPATFGSPTVIILTFQLVSFLSVN
ncbi:ADP-ribosyl cyclase isoform 4 [Strongylocentrotus purpuratus]|uniref:ADP-ribosyl cyclase isoform 4 n=1 Tax=Strongylocentrotus purpuratus TaxID=7668 RepID=G8XYP7_STRPU|nr:ADP-ribosyl cyclase isoform 4 [Strongylocentrotus purpuratus]CBI83143.1 ADP-ribosyl cyclase isoform 4 [Strongylocentrotus purpuratus]|eukprot:NP_001243005.1 ADP-ribosyl cyclase isoform 4 [Strongylocentrotus purpuratus]